MPGSEHSNVQQNGWRERQASGRYELDDGPGLARLGLIALANDRVIERDMVLMRPDDETLIYTARIRFEGECTLENLSTMSSDLTGAAELLDPSLELGAIMFGCTSGTVALGAEQVAAAVGAAHPDVACIDPIGAALGAFAELGVQRVSVLAPYIDAVAEPIVSAFDLQGINVVGQKALGIVDSADISRVTPQSIYENALLADGPDAEALFIACTDFRSLEVIEAVETEIGKPVITSNQALLWSAMRAAGRARRVGGFGRLMHGAAGRDGIPDAEATEPNNPLEDVGT